MQNNTQSIQQLAQAAANALRAEPEYLQMYYEGDAGYMDAVDDALSLAEHGEVVFEAAMQQMHVLLDYATLGVG